MQGGDSFNSRLHAGISIHFGQNKNFQVSLLLPSPLLLTFRFPFCILCGRGQRTSPRMFLIKSPPTIQLRSDNCKLLDTPGHSGGRTEKERS